jgi:hypothetical protein
MKLSWNNLKISIAGAKLSHLVQRDRIWDHGSMVEQVKIVFQQLHKSVRQPNADLIRKYMTLEGYNKAREQILKLQNEIKNEQIFYQVAEVDIIKVAAGSNSKPDCFEALVKEIRKRQDWPANMQKEIKKELQEIWVFIRQGDWWLLNEIRPPASFFSIRQKFFHH